MIGTTILNIEQGSEEWLKARLNNLCASEAPAMMGESKFMSRNQLLDLKKGWLNNPDPVFMKRLYQKGHDNEDRARQLFEASELCFFPPVVAIRHHEELNLLSSFDGLESGQIGGMIWEHKLYNDTLAENVRNGILEPLYYWQLEHQCLVNDSDQVTFQCSDENNMVSMTYTSQPERRKALIDGWKLFEKDLAAHELKAKSEKVAPESVSLPAITAKVSGTEIQTNIVDCLAAVKSLSAVEATRTLETDQDFANKEQLNKDVKKARATLKQTQADIEGQFVSYAEFSATVKEVDSVLQKLQSSGEKLVKEEKQRRKDSIVIEARKGIDDFISEYDQRNSIKVSWVVNVNPDFVGVMKGKSNIESIRASVDEEAARVKLEISQVMEIVEKNLEFYKDGFEADYSFLFADLASIVNQPFEAFQAVIKMRVSDHKEAEERRLEAEREKIREEERQRAQTVQDSSEEPAEESQSEMFSQKDPANANEEDSGPYGPYELNGINIHQFTEDFAIEFQLDIQKAKQMVRRILETFVK